jgi:hypothetical protein
MLYADNRCGNGNIGVTAITAMHAKILAKETLLKFGWTHIPEDLIDKAEVIANIDIRMPDENHVLPNIGVVSRQGVWFPNFNS